MCVRKARVEDKEAIIKIWRKSEDMLGKPQHAALNRAINAGYCHVAEKDGVILGFVEYYSRKDGVNTIYHIATSEEARNQGIGASLLWSIPCPIRLKVTVDNAKAIQFYEHHHMVRIAEEISRTGRLLYVYELKTLFIQVAGNNKKWPEICRTAGIAYGSRHDDKIRAWPTMIDINWERYDWNQYLEIIKVHKPILAMVADYERPEQKELMLSQVQALRDLGVLRVMVCPKFAGAIADIPNDCVIAVSVPTKYAGYIPPLAELKNKKVHLLGGSPVKQRKTYFMLTDTDYNIQIISMDGNSHTFAGGMIWRGSKWKKNPTHLPYYDIVSESARNIGELMNNLERATTPLFVA